MEKRTQTSDVSAKEMSKRWGVSERTVAKYCREGKVPGAIKIGNRWLIPAEAFKPPTDTELKKILFLTLQLKNNPSFPIDYHSVGFTSEDMANAYRYLERLSLIKMPKAGVKPENIPYEATLTQRGFAMLEQKGASLSVSVDTEDMQKAVMSLAPSMIQLITEIIKATSS